MCLSHADQAHFSAQTAGKNKPNRLVLDVAFTAQEARGAVFEVRKKRASRWNLCLEVSSVFLHQNAPDSDEI